MAEIPSVQMVLEADAIHALLARPHPAPPTVAITELGPADISEMRALVALTQPGPFGPRTPELGRYIGVRHDGELLAMAGERLRLDGATEISAVCTRPDHRGRGLAAALVVDAATHIAGRGDLPFLHAAATNTDAIRVYEKLGFTLRRMITAIIIKAPSGHE